MTISVGSSGTQTTNLANSYVKMMKLIVKSKAPLVKKFKTSANPVQKRHTWTYDTVATPTSVNATAEGAEEATAAPADLGQGVNDCQIIQKGYAVSGTQEVTLYQGVDNYLALQKKKAIETIGLDLEWAVLNGTGLSTGARNMKGIRAFASANTDCTATGEATAFATTAGEDAVNTMLTAMWEVGATADMLICSAVNQGKIDKWSGYNSKFQDVSNSELNSTITVYRAKTGRVEVLMHAMANATDIYGVVSDDCYVAYLRPPKTKMLPETVDGIPFVARMEATLEVRGPYSAAYTVLS